MPSSSIEHATFEIICKFLRENTGIDLNAEKKYLIEARLRPLLKTRGFATFNDLAIALSSKKCRKLTSEVIDAATTNETFFYRDVSPFEVIEKTLLPELIEARGNLGLTIWSAACSTGQEPYSIAMSISEKFPGLWTRGTQILASDISENVLERAKAGIFSQTEVNRGLPSHQLSKYFKKQGANFHIDDSLKCRIKFFKQNLLESWHTVPPCDLILMRNVLIYFNLETKRKILAAVRRKLKPGGYLMLGAAETTLNIDPAFVRRALPGVSVYSEAK